VKESGYGRAAGSAPPGGKAVFVLSNPAKWRHFLPVIGNLERNHGMESCVLALGEMHGSPSDVEHLRELGLDFIQPLPRPVRSEIDRLVQGLRLKREAGTILRRLGASVLIVHSDRTLPENLFIPAARAAGIPSLLMQESLRKDEMMRMGRRSLAVRRAYRRLFGLEFRLRLYGQGGCDSVNAWGPFSERYFLRAGVPAERIAPLGNPVWDRIPDVTLRESERERLAAHLGLPSDARFLTLVTSPLSGMGLLSEAEYRRILARWSRPLAEAAARGGAALVLKTHNLEAAGIYREAFAGIPVHFLEKWDIIPLLAHSVGVLQFSTTAGLEAALLGTPVGLLDAGRPLDNWEFAANGVGTPLATPDHLRRFVEEISTPRGRGEIGARGRQRACIGYAANFGGAAAALAAHIRGLASHMRTFPDRKS
jgi:hypothetical protein